MTRWLLGPHSPDSFVVEEWVVELVGGKGAALVSLPEAWVPSYGVITTEAHSRWLGLRERVGSLAAARNALADVSASDLRALSAGSARLIVRSSATQESLGERGLHRSVETGDSKEQVASACKLVWDASLHEPGKMAVLVQPLIKSLASGHLSNERRLTQKKSDWVCQIDSGVVESRCHRVRAEKTDPGLGDPLYCDEEARLVKVLARVATFGYSFEDRVHFEWVWDGKRVWVVQADTDSVPAGAVRPGDPWLEFASQNRVNVEPEIGPFEVLKPWNDSNSEWGKVSCLNVFSECGLPVPRVYLLESPEYIAQLRSGDAPASLERDLDHLLECPIVIRTNVKSEEGSEVLSPRTDVVMGREDALGFMQRTAQELDAGGVSDKDFCFLIHRYVPAKAAAIAFGTPDGGRVLIDATYGSPDSLLYYSHDSYECGVRGGSKQQQLRCKDEFVDIGPDGLWSRYWCEQPHDWRSSLTDEAIRTIATSTSLTAARAGKPITLMFFVDVDVRSGYPSVLPWVYFAADYPLSSHSPGASRIEGRAPLIRNLEDVRSLHQAFVDATDAAGLPRSIRVWPDVDLVRSDEFTDAIVTLAHDHDLAIELQGSVLSHVFYVLRREAVRVRCVDPFAPHGSEQVFDKLVRDGIPQRIKSGGEKVATKAIGETEYDLRLKMKAVEEALELAGASDRDAILEESADVYEVIRSLVASRGASIADVVRVADRKREERGGFDGKVVLLGTAESSPLSTDDDQLSLLEGELADGSSQPIEWRHESSGVRKGRTLELSLVPPLIGGSSATYRMELGGHTHEIEVVYRGSTIQVALREPRVQPAEHQLKLEGLD